MKNLFVPVVLLMALSTVGAAAPLGACANGVLSTYIGNSCTLGDKMFDTFAYTGNVASVNVAIQFQMVGNEFHLILSPVLGAGLFQTFSFMDSITVLPGVAPNVLPAVYQIVAVKEQGFFSAVPGSAGALHIVNTPGPTYDLAPGTELGGPTAVTPTSAITTVSTMTGGNPGLSSLELDYVQANTTVLPEPASVGLIGLGLLGLSMRLRKRSA